MNYGRTELKEDETDGEKKALACFIIVAFMGVAFCFGVIVGAFIVRFL